MHIIQNLKILVVDTQLHNLSNKRSPTIIIIGKIFQALRSYLRPFVYLFLKKIIEKLGENRKKWLFSKASL